MAAGRKKLTCQQTVVSERECDHQPRAEALVCFYNLSKRGRGALYRNRYTPYSISSNLNVLGGCSEGLDVFRFFLENHQRGTGMFKTPSLLSFFRNMDDCSRVDNKKVEHLKKGINLAVAYGKFGCGLRNTSQCE